MKPIPVGPRGHRVAFAVPKQPHGTPEEEPADCMADIV